MKQNNFTVKHETDYKRCEICHQSDKFDTVNNICYRCAKIKLSVFIEKNSGSCEKLNNSIEKYRKDIERYRKISKNIHLLFEIFLIFSCAFIAIFHNQYLFLYLLLILFLPAILISLLAKNFQNKQ
jgi:hypothetical protein